MKQQCFLFNIYFSWIVYLGTLAVSVWHSDWVLAAVVLIGAPMIQRLYIHFFPSLSAGMGYGEINDEAPQSTRTACGPVTLYTALGCPFCPLMEERLKTLQGAMNFRFEKIDVTLRPDLLASKGIRSVPVVEVDGRLLVGLTSTKELAAAIAQPARDCAVCS